ncbi:MAG: hypothetical protein ACI376_09365 [Candidatus Bruticola sp.]
MYSHFEHDLTSEERQIPATVPELEPGSEEIAITKVIYEQLTKQNCLQPGERESVAYRFAEIMVSAKNLYMDILPRLANCSDKTDSAESSNKHDDSEEHSPSECLSENEEGCDSVIESPIFGELAGARMAFIHLRDLIADFDDAFMVAMASQREADERSDRLEEADFEYEG